eukprot:CAMPEP_0201529438 /NCGR_PEP_ID=MMETSP0161_2-20130828/41755_1 /ASSEMBLY_ACC=CAM_ASM_000251 /TAXON_ID=180227 /ORGANISM="Neoparamoeba aestuarina, Strain SoJaBio B1-5/56/2" /LENGTH=184 /DNA_ID=CAMNT_0047931243 /DNA_START=1 /DNA_END=555 /DNA_ORIENTATION=+
MAMSDDENPFEKLKELFKEVGDPCTASDLKIITNGGWTGSEGCKIALPSELVGMWSVGREWHLIEDHCEVFGFNLMDCKSCVDNVVQLFGDEEMRKEWGEEEGEGGVNCGLNGWLPFCAVSEFEFYFVCVDENSPHYGGVRRMKNNTCEDTVLTIPPFSNFVERLTVEDLLKYDESGDDDDEDD